MIEGKEKTREACILQCLLSLPCSIAHLSLSCIYTYITVRGCAVAPASCYITPTALVNVKGQILTPERIQTDINKFLQKWNAKFTVRSTKPSKCKWGVPRDENIASCLVQ